MCSGSIGSPSGTVCMPGVCWGRGGSEVSLVVLGPSVPRWLMVVPLSLVFEPMEGLSILSQGVLGVCCFSGGPVPNCGGLGGKTDRLVALLVFVEADVVCLQEVAGLTAAAVAGLGYRFAEGAARRSGGLVTLLHNRLFAGGQSLSLCRPRPMAAYCGSPRLGTGASLW